MTNHGRLFALLAGLIPAACSSPTDTNAGTGGTTSGTGEELDVCEQFIECLGAIAPDEVEIMQIVIDECFAQPSNSEQICFDACDAGLTSYRENFPNEPACGGVAPECEEDADCGDPAAPSCYPDLTCGPECGNGRLDAGEQCDPGALEACSSSCELLEHDCSPVDNTGCPEGSKCTLGIDMQNTELIYFTCAPDFIGPGTLQDPCMLQSECSLEAPLCTSGVSGCTGGGDQCCVPYCYLGETSLDIECPSGLSCAAVSEELTFSGNTWKPGIELFGVCL